MPGLIESRVPDEEESSTGVSTPRTALNSIIKAEVSLETFTSVQPSTISQTNKKQSIHSPLRKLFLNITKPGRSPVSESNNALIVRASLAKIPLGPATYLRPLEHKLQPRIEPRFKSTLLLPAPTPDDAMRTPSEEGRAIAQNRERTELILNGANSDNLSIADLDTTDSESSSSLDGEVDETDDMEVGEQMTREELEARLKKEIITYHSHLAVNGARRKSLIPAWRDYIECYSMRKFNLSNPPFPPRARSAFSYLPSMYPGFEVERRSLDESLDVFWWSWSQAMAGTIIRTVMRHFHTDTGSISFFDQDNELFKVENGYSKAFVARSVSIAAHVLLSDDVLVILDTHKDWRFKSNPLAINEEDSIRFYAGAPILTDAGLPVGVLSIFSDKPRKSFTPDQRRELQEFSSKTMKSLIHDREKRPQRSTPILQRESVINGDYHPLSDSPAPSNSTDTERNPFTVGLSFPQARAPRDRYSATLHRLQRSRDLHDWVRQSGQNLPTPPPTASDKGRGFDLEYLDFSEVSNQNFQGYRNNNQDPFQNNYNNQQQASSGNGVAMFPSLQDMLIPDCVGYGYRSSRPFSSSDITSLNLQPTNTPCNSLIFSSSAQTYAGERVLTGSPRTSEAERYYRTSPQRFTAEGDFTTPAQSHEAGIEYATSPQSYAAELDFATPRSHEAEMVYATSPESYTTKVNSATPRSHEVKLDYSTWPESYPAKSNLTTLQSHAEEPAGSISPRSYTADRDSTTPQIHVEEPDNATSPESHTVDSYYAASPQNYAAERREEDIASTPVRFENDSQDITLEEFLGLSDEDCLEQLEVGLDEKGPNMHSSPLIDLSSPQNQHRLSEKADSKSSVETARPLNTPEAIEDYEAAFVSFSLNAPESDPQTIATYACTFMAQHLDFDLTYAVELSPKLPNMRYSQLVALGGMEKRIVAGYNMLVPMELSTAIHLNALRSRVGVSYRFEKIPDVDDDFETGYLLPIHTEQRALSERSSGIVIGAFRKRRTNYVEREDEAVYLRQMIDAFESRFLKGAQADHQRRSQSETAEPKPFPANEAVDISDKFYEMPRGRQLRRIPDKLPAQPTRMSHSKKFSDGHEDKKERISSPSRIPIPTNSIRRAYPPQYARDDPASVGMQYYNTSGSNYGGTRAEATAAQIARQKYRKK